ncbi:hypothetical protein DB41_DL00020 [Neochlamydia sp. TUME1]|nr:hypothetical protein DB41_DL00020 [Neochlamydia sp. TUME1]
MAKTLALAKPCDAKHRKHRLFENFKGRENEILNLTDFLFTLKLRKISSLDKQALILASADKFTDSQ